MQPASKSRNWVTQDIDPANEPPTKIQAIEVPEAESDEEYEAVPNKSRQKTPPGPILSSTPILAAPTQPAVTDEVIVDTTAPDATDDDWLRSRTNRLLDLMDPTELSVGTGVVSNAGVNAVAETATTTEEPSEPKKLEELAAEENRAETEHEKPDAVVEAIRTNGRLFARNLPYAASEDELRKHFEPYGSLEEVRVHRFSFIYSSCAS